MNNNKYDVLLEDEGFKEGFWTGTKKLFLFILCTIIIATGAIILVIFLSNQTTELKASMRIENLMQHLKILQEIADANGGTRTTGIGLNASTDYVVKMLREHDYDASIQVFNITQYRNINSEFHFIDPFNEDYDEKHYSVFPYSGNGNVTGKLYHVENRGCDLTDFDGFQADDIALIRRGTCNFIAKIEHAISKQARAVIIYNSGDNGQLGLFNGNLGITQLASIPLIATTYDLGTSFTTFPDAIVNIYVQGQVDLTYTRNVIAETKGGNPGRVIVVGSHLDSVPEGAGINDNGSGSSLNLELAIQSAKYLSPQQKVRFIWFGGEELGLLGSTHYVEDLALNHPEDLKKIVLNLNFDMVASPNFQRGVYNGSSATDLTILKACSEIQKLFEKYFSIKNLTNIPVPFNGRSDYGPFISRSIPAGGLFTGAEEVKDEASRRLFGGFANTAYDPCYHKNCDNIDNINQEVFLQNANAAAYVLQTLASSKDIEKTLNGGETERWSTQMREYKRVNKYKSLIYQ